MRTTTVPFELRAWRHRMGWTQAEAACALGLSLSGYCRAEYRNEDDAAHAANKTVALLALELEHNRSSIGDSTP